MPRGFWYFAQLLPTTWMIDAARGVILRGAGWAELWLNALVMWSSADEDRECVVVEGGGSWFVLMSSRGSTALEQRCASYAAASWIAGRWRHAFDRTSATDPKAA